MPTIKGTIEIWATPKHCESDEGRCDFLSIKNDEDFCILFKEYLPDYEVPNDSSWSEVPRCKKCLDTFKE